MRDLTREELQEYFQFVREDTHPADFNEEQARLVGEVAQEHHLLENFTRKMLSGLAEGIPPDHILISYWVWAFQMGRECESRLLTRALKGKVGK